MLFEFLFGGRVDNSEVGLDDNVGYEGAVGRGTETWSFGVSETGWWGEMFGWRWVVMRMIEQMWDEINRSFRGKKLTMRCERSGARRVSVDVEDFACGTVGI